MQELGRCGRQEKRTLIVGYFSEPKDWFSMSRATDRSVHCVCPAFRAHLLEAFVWRGYQFHSDWFASAILGHRREGMRRTVGIGFVERK